MGRPRGGLWLCFQPSRFVASASVAAPPVRVENPALGLAAMLSSGCASREPTWTLPTSGGTPPPAAAESEGEEEEEENRREAQRKTARETVTAMGGFFSTIFSSLFGTREMRILILGLDGAGKTTILYRLQVGEVVTTIPRMISREGALCFVWGNITPSSTKEGICIELDGSSATTTLLTYPAQKGKLSESLQLLGQQRDCSVSLAAQWTACEKIPEDDHMIYDTATIHANCQASKFLSCDHGDAAMIVSVKKAIGFNVETVTYKNLKFQVWDLGGQTSIRPYWRCYYSNTDAVIYVVDSCDRDRIGISKSELVAMLEEEELKKAILVVFANKQDMEQAMTPTEMANALGLPALKDRKWQIFKTSATKGTGLDEAMEWLVETLKSRQ